MTTAVWIEPKYSRAKIDHAGRTLVNFANSSDYDISEGHKIDSALDIFVNWRASHGYPLNTAQMVLRHRAKRTSSTALISQRHKREYSIVKKLSRSGSMRLSQMQDIAGCRAVLSTIKQVDILRRFYENEIRNDYISIPPSSGYRSIHAVSKYQGKTKTAFDGLYVETQIRTALQHAWATAVETVDTFTGSDLKSGFGDDDWKRLFALVSSAFAILEQCPTVPGTSESMRSIVREIKLYEHELSLLQRLRTWHMTSDVVRDPSFKFRKYLLIEQRPSTGLIRLYTYGAGQFEEATKKYSELEQEVTRENRLQVVMASANSLSSLKRAYPNLFADPTEFVKAYERILE